LIWQGGRCCAALIFGLRGNAALPLFDEVVQSSAVLVFVY
jgi:hypothetical protein